jgi:hypothetical protein
MQLADGRTLQVDEVHQIETYAGHLEGPPNARVNGMILGGIPRMADRDAIVAFLDSHLDVHAYPDYLPYFNETARHHPERQTHELT